MEMGRRIYKLEKRRLHACGVVARARVARGEAAMAGQLA